MLGYICRVPGDVLRWRVRHPSSYAAVHGVLEVSFVKPCYPRHGEVGRALFVRVARMKVHKGSKVYAVMRYSGIYATPTILSGVKRHWD